MLRLALNKQSNYKVCLLKTFTMEELFKHLAVQRRHSGASERDLPGFQMQSFSSIKPVLFNKKVASGVIVNIS